MLHPRQPPPLAYRLVKGVLRRTGTEFLAVSAPEPLDAVLVHQRFAGGEEEVAVEPAGRHLRSWVETAQRFEFVAEEIQP